MPEKSNDHDATKVAIVTLLKSMRRHREQAASALLLVFMTLGFAASLAVIWALAAPEAQATGSPAAATSGEGSGGSGGSSSGDGGGEGPGRVTPAGENSGQGVSRREDWTAPESSDQAPTQRLPNTGDLQAERVQPDHATPGAQGPEKSMPLGFASRVSDMDPVQPQPEPEPSAALGTIAGPSSGENSTGGNGEDRAGEEAGATFFGQRGEGTRFVYVIDKSGSMSGPRFEAARDELIRSLRDMGRRASFFVVFYDNEADPMPAAGLVPASGAAKRHYLDWVRGVSVGGGTDPTEAVVYALEKLSPDTIWLLSDGQFKEEIADFISRANRLRNIQINTIAFHDRSGEAILRRIASENHGDYRFVPAP